MDEALFQSKWLRIQVLLMELDMEPYIDDQDQIREIWEIGESIIKTVNLTELSLEFKRDKWKDILSHWYYDEYGVYDPMHEICYALAIKEEEELTLARLLAGYRQYSDAAVFYKKYDRLKEYSDCMSHLLGKDTAPYLELLDYYEQHGMHQEALDVAHMTLKKCRDKGMTEIFLFLVKDAYATRQWDLLGKLVKSTKLRQYVDDQKIDAWLEEQDGQFK